MRCSATPCCRASRQVAGGPARDAAPPTVASPMSALDGNIGCIVNGAGLAMATMDMIKARAASLPTSSTSAVAPRPSGWPRHFGWCCPIRMCEAILVNIFAGINRCDWVAEGVVQALRRTRVNIPVVVRLAGTNVEEGRRILARSRPADHPRRDSRRGGPTRRRSLATTRQRDKIARPQGANP